jgi:hypothetical protein
MTTADAQLAEDGEEHEHREELVLEALLRRVGVVEAEADEERDERAEYDLGVDVGRTAPVLLEDTA